jgi:hypothetical protein
MLGRPTTTPKSALANIAPEKTRAPLLRRSRLHKAPKPR